MLISMTRREAQALAAELYSGASKPLTDSKLENRPLDCEWWRQPRKAESFSSDRHRGALALYLQLAAGSQLPLRDRSFPSRFDFANGKPLLPDKGFIKMCLNAEPPILTCRISHGHLVFDLTEVGAALLEII